MKKVYVSNCKLRIYTASISHEHSAQIAERPSLAQQSAHLQHNINCSRLSDELSANAKLSCPPLSCEPLLPHDTDTLPRYRHAAPSGPWPWMDFSHIDVTSASTAVATDVATDESDDTTAVTDASTATQWSGYPQNLFGNWTPTQVERSQMLAKCSKNRTSTIYWMDVGNDGKFTNPDVAGGGHTSTVTTAHPEKFWEVLRPEVNLACQLVS